MATVEILENDLRYPPPPLHKNHENENNSVSIVVEV